MLMNFIIGHEHGDAKTGIGTIKPSTESFLTLEKLTEQGEVAKSLEVKMITVQYLEAMRISIFPYEK